MKISKYLPLAVCLATSVWSTAQTALRELTVDDLTSWRRITAQSISDDGRWVACKIEPWEGDATVHLYGAQGKEAASFPSVDKFLFSASADFLVMEQSPRKALVDSLKVLKTKKDKMPMNNLLIYSLAEKKNNEENIDSLKSFKLAKNVDWVAYQRGRKDSTLYVRHLDASVASCRKFPAVKEFGFAEKSGMLYYVSAGDKGDVKPGLYVLNAVTGTSALVKEGRGVFKQITFDEQGEQLAFLYCAQKDSAYKATALWLSTHAAPARQVVSCGHRALPQGWVVNGNGKLRFSKTAARLFFGTSPEPRQKDTLQLEENRPEVQVWSWNEPVQYTAQNHNKEKELKRTYEAVYNIGDETIVQLADAELPQIQLGNEGDAPLALLSTSLPYSLPSMWEGRTRSDYYAVSLDNGERRLLAQADYGRYRLSPEGKYAYWYAETDSCWYTLSMADGKKVRLTTPETFVAWNEENDVPDYPASYGVAGWTQHDEELLIYDRYDIWKFNPAVAVQPVCLTVNGRENRISYRLLSLDKETRFIDLSQPQLLKGFNEVTKGYGYYRSGFTAPAIPHTLLAGDYMLRNIVKAKHTNDVAYTVENFERYPDVLRSTLDFRKSIQLTHECEQQKGVRWGTAELVSWTSLDGRRLEGVVYKPADFNPDRKYPVIVNFYERNSETLHNYRMPEPHRSTVDYHLYNSNGYIIFNPDFSR